MASSSSLHKAVWETADTFLRNRVPRQDYGDYILPFTVLRRMEAILEPTKAEVLEFLIEYENDAEHIVGNLIYSRFGLPFYSRSPLSLTMIAQSADSVRQGLLTYVGSFSSSVRDVFTAFDFDKRTETLQDRNVLWGVVNHFASLDLSDSALVGGENESAENVLGDLFEHLMFRSFSENGQVAGEFYTPREVIRLMVDVLLSSDDDGPRGKYPARSVCEAFLADWTQNGNILALAA